MPEACRRLACDGAITRVLVTRQPQPGGPHPGDDPQGEASLAARLRTAMALLPPVLGGAPSQPLDVGRASRVITPTQRSALAVGDGGCGFPACARPLAWCEGHHLVSWLDGGRTDLDNLALLCRAHHRAIHAGGWQLTRGPDGRLTATPPHRRPPPHRRQRAMA
jgi:HNH endonuclease